MSNDEGRLTFLSAGCRELAAKIQRLRLGVCLWLESKKLRRAEFELGWLGWQQADFFGTEMECEIEKIRQFEREQVELVNTSAELEEQLRHLEQQRAETRRRYEAEIAAILEKRQPVIEALAGQEKAMSGKRRELARLERALKELDELPVILTRRYAELSAIEPQTSDIRSQLILLSDRRLAIPAEMKSVCLQKENMAREIENLESELQAQRTLIESSEAEELGRREALAGSDAAYVERIRATRDETRSSQKRIDSLDGKKREPFLEVGRCLADHGIAPLNQPEALAQVHRLRANHAQLRQELALSRAHSGEIERAQLHKCGALVLVLALLVAALIFATHGAPIPR